MRRYKRGNGFTLVEAMLTLSVLAVAAVGMPLALGALSHVPGGNDRALAASAELASELEYWRSTAWTGSAWSSLPYAPASDTVAVKFGGQTVNMSRTISIQKWDPNNISANTSPQTDFVRLQITIDSRTVTLYLSKLL